MFLSSLLIGLLGLATMALSVAGGPPNVVIILADDLGSNDIGYNNPKMKTPHMDRLAKTGRKLTQSYFQSTCSPSRAVLLTGRYAHTIRMEMPLGPATAHCLPTNVKLLPAYLKDVGYKTHLIGKWHLGFCQQGCLPHERGFDTFEGLLVGMGDYYNHTDCEGFRHYDWNKNGVPDKSVIGKYATTLITERAESILQEHDPTDGPFFMFLSHVAPHVPLQAPPHFIEMYNSEPNERRRTYMAQVSALDMEINRVVNALKSNGHYDNTVIFFSSDNGGEGITGPSDNAPLRGVKASLWEGGSRVVGFVHSPLLENKGVESDGLVHVSDWLPSILSMAGVDPASYAGRHIDGIDQSGLFLRGEDSSRSEVPININPKPVSIVGHNAIRIDDYKLLWGFTGVGDGYGENTYIAFDPNNQYVEPGFNPIDDIAEPYRRLMAPGFIQAFVPACLASMVIPGNINSGEVHLYNVKEDPGETNDLAGLDEHQARILYMKHRVLHHTQFTNMVPQIPPRAGPAVAALVDDTWSTGWCDDLTITVPQ